MALDVTRPLAERIKGPRPDPEVLRSLGASLQWLRSEGLLLETDVEVNPDLEITGVQKHLDGTIPILFHNVMGHPHLEAVTNLFTNIEILDRMFGYETPRRGRASSPTRSRTRSGRRSSARARHPARRS